MEHPLAKSFVKLEVFFAVTDVFRSFIPSRLQVLQQSPQLEKSALPAGYLIEGLQDLRPEPGLCCYGMCVFP